MGFEWVSSHGDTLNADFRVRFAADEARDGMAYNFGTQPARGEEAPGIGVFFRDDAGEVFRTYST